MVLEEARKETIVERKRLFFNRANGERAGSVPDRKSWWQISMVR